MRRKALSLGVMCLMAICASLGLWRGIKPNGAVVAQMATATPTPIHDIQPFSPDSSFSGLSSMTLGAWTMDLVDTRISRGDRITIPGIYSAPEFGIRLDKDTAPGTVLGDVIAEIDLQCDTSDTSPTDWFAMATPGPPNLTGYPWKANTTKIQLTGETWLAPLVPPYSWLLRHTANVDNFWLNGEVPFKWRLQLNTVFTSVPWSANGSATASTTRNGGDPEVINPARHAVCFDTPQNSISHTSDYTNPAKTGDGGRACSGGNCAEGSIYNFSTVKNIKISPIPGSVTVPVKKTVLNNGPDAGKFTDLWEIEVSNPLAVAATWNNGKTKKTTDVNLGANAALGSKQDLTVTCTEHMPSISFVWLFNTLTPVDPTQDPNRKNNFDYTYIVVNCDPPSATPVPLPTVDKQVIWVQASAVGTAVPPSDVLPEHPQHLNLLLGQAITVTLDELKANHNAETVPGQEWLVAEVSKTSLTHPTAVPPADDRDLSVAWDLNSVTIDQGTHGPPAATVTPVASCTSGDACITYQVSEPAGQSDVKADLTIDCPLTITPGTYAVAVAAIDLPVGYSESKPADNAQRSVITVNCWASYADWESAKDGIDDGTGLYARWTYFQSQPDSRLDVSLIPSDKSAVEANMQGPQGIYVERTIQVACYWMDPSGCWTDATNGSTSCDGSAGSAANGYIDVAESHNDYDLLQLTGQTTGTAAYDTIDPDHDCLPIAAYTQPGHDVDLPNSVADLTTKCTATDGWVDYAGSPTKDATDYPNTKAADHDCDGLVDGVEEAWGSNPLAADTDSDGAPDFVEMGQFTNPNDPDTDGDGLWDKPENNYQAAGVSTPDPPAPERGAECANNRDDDLDGYVNDGCPKVGTASETGANCDEPPATCTDADGKAPWDHCDNDNDGFINDGCYWSVGGVNGAGKPDPVVNGVANSDDNCPTVYNPDQLNTDGKSIDAGGGAFASNPNQDVLGDACDPDIDNDNLINAIEAAMGTNLLQADSDSDGWVNDGCPQVGSISEASIAGACANNKNDDPADDSKVNDGCPQYGPVPEPASKCSNAIDDDSDGCVDGAEAFLGTGSNPLNGNADSGGVYNRCPALTGTNIISNDNLKFYHACRWNEPGGANPNIDPDGDSLDCDTHPGDFGATGAYDDDNDNGVGTVASQTVTEVQDIVEIEGYNTNPALKDTDGDGCADWFEIADVNGTRTLTVGDLYLVATAPTGVAANDRVMDFNKDGKQSVGDSLLEAMNSCAVKPGVGGCPVCPQEK